MRVLQVKTYLFLIFISVGVHTACTTVPITGRSQMTGLIDSQEVMQLSAEAYRQVVDSVKLSNNEEQVAMIKHSGTRIQKAVEQYFADRNQSEILEGFHWEFNLIDNDTAVNAWAMPGGKVAFYTGILPICKDELGIAVVMGHEVAHAIARHGQERMNTSYAQQVGLSLGALALGEDPTVLQRILFEAVGIGSNVATLSFSRRHESEADELGLIFMAIAGYNPEEAPIFWERMAATSGGQAPLEFLSTHPSHQTRVERLKAAMPRALEYFKASKGQ